MSVGRAAAGAVTIAAALLAGCGGEPRPTTSAAPSAAPTPSRPHPPQLLYVWRNFEETGVPEEMTIYADGRLRYRNLLHTQKSFPVRKTRLRSRELRTLRRLVRAVDLRRADASGVTPRRDGYRYVISSRGRTGTAADGHLHGPIRPLVVRLGQEMDRLRRASL